VSQRIYSHWAQTTKPNMCIHHMIILQVVKYNNPFAANVSTAYCSCHSKDPTIAVLPVKLPRFGAKMVIFFLAMSTFVLTMKGLMREAAIFKAIPLHYQETNYSQVKNFFVIAFIFIWVLRREQCKDRVHQLGAL
jgi:hypothetical protein